MANRRWLCWILRSAALLACVVALGCGYTESEMQATVHDVAQLKDQLNTEEARSRKARGELDEATAKIEQLRSQLNEAGLDLSNLTANLEEQARALEEHRRRAQQLEALRKRFEVLRGKLGPLAKLGLNVVVRRNRVTLQLPADALFDAGRETLTRDGVALLVKVAAVVRSDAGLSSRTFQVAGHTDDAPAVGARFKDNWGLSVLRARDVLALLVTATDRGGGGLDPARWSAAGYGGTDPVRPNDQPEGKAANRRCEIVLLPSAEETLDLKSLSP